MATVVIQKRVGVKGTTYAVKYFDPLTGKKRHYRSYKKYKEARLQAHELRMALDLGRVPEPKRAKLCPLSFGEVAASLRTEWASRVRRNSLSEKTFRGYADCLRVLERAYGRVLLCRLGSADVECFVDEKLSSFTPVTANKYISMFRMVFEHGIKVGAALSNPASEVRRLDERLHERKRYILPDDLDRLLRCCGVCRAKFYLPAVVCLGAEHGASKQEVLSLEWRDINFGFQERGVIRFFRTKNRRERTEFLMPRTREALLGWRRHLVWKRRRTNVGVPRSDRVFCRVDGTPIKRFDKSWHTALEAAGIGDFHFHDLRHTFGSNLLLAGADLKDVKEMLGHRHISMTDRYTHLSGERKSDVQDRLARHYCVGAVSSGSL